MILILEVGGEGHRPGVRHIDALVAEHLTIFVHYETLNYFMRKEVDRSTTSPTLETPAGNMSIKS